MEAKTGKQRRQTYWVPCWTQTRFLSTPLCDDIRSVCAADGAAVVEAHRILNTHWWPRGMERNLTSICNRKRRILHPRTFLVSTREQEAGRAAGKLMKIPTWRSGSCWRKSRKECLRSTSPLWSAVSRRTKLDYSSRHMECMYAGAGQDHWTRSWTS